MSLFVHRAERTDLLADALAEVLATSVLDPLAEEVVVVPAKGVERWLTQRLSHRLGTSGQPGGGKGIGTSGGRGDGVCAGVRFLTPSSLVGLLTGRERDDPWHPDRLVWPVLQVVDAALDETWAAPLAAHLGHRREGEERELRAGRRYALARRLAGLFHSYATQRPAVLTDWRLGRDLDGAGQGLESDLAWQPQLWRRVLDAVDAPPPDVRHTDTLARLREGGAALDLPDRLSLFGHTRLPRTEIELLGALGERRDVHLWLPQVSARVWRELEPVCAPGPVRRADDTSADHVAHPLLASLGRDARELQRGLALVEPLDDVVTGPDAAAPSLLHWLQHDLRAGELPDPATRQSRQVGEHDRSVQVHACHGPARQVEVLREALLGLLADDPSLEPRDIIVMCPDIEAYAPLVQAAFGLGDAGGSEPAPPSQGAASGRHPAHRLRVRLADRALTSTNPLAGVATQLLGLVGARMAVSDLLDLAAAEPVRRRFSFDDDDLDQIGRWVEQAAVRWGFDAEARAPFGLAHVGQNTWRFGLDRLLLGVAVSQEGDALGPALPVDDVAGGDIDLLGRFTEFVERVGAAVGRLQDAVGAADWMTALGDGVHGLADVAPDDSWQSAQLDRELAGVVDAADPGTRLRLSDVRGLLAHRFAARPTRANFRTGTLTVSTMVPMRSVPHRVVALLGLDDGVFPRGNTVDGDDVLARAPMTGERDPRSEDRQLLLDAVMAATEHLLITYTGAGEHTGGHRPPAVPLGELLDALADTACLPGDLVVRHPLQPFDARNFTPAALGAPTPFSFDAASLAGARVAQAPRTARPVLIEAPLAPTPAGDVDLAELIAFFANPARDFLRSRLDVTAPREGDDPLDAMPVSLDALEKWSVGDRLLGDALQGVDAARAMDAERLRGLLPPRALAEPVLADVTGIVGALVGAAGPLREGPAGALDVDVDLGGGRRLLGTATDLYGLDGPEPRQVLVGYSSLAPKRRLESWITLLALTASGPPRPWRAHVVARRGTRAVTVVGGPLPPEQARERLLELVDVYDRARREPLPLPSRTAFAYAETFLGADPESDPAGRAAREWYTNIDRDNAPPGESDDAWITRVYGRSAPLDVLLEAPRPDEAWNQAPTRLGQYAVRVWEPVLRGGQEVR